MHGLKRQQEFLTSETETDVCSKVSRINTDEANSSSFDPMAVLKNILINHSLNKNEAQSTDAKALPLELMKKCLNYIQYQQTTVKDEEVTDQGNDSDESQRPACHSHNVESFTSSGEENVKKTSEDTFDDHFLYMRQKAVENEYRKNFYNYEKPSMFQTMLFSSELSPNLKLLEKHDDMLRRFGSFDECGSKLCSKNLTREHFHCVQCERVIIRREEMVRHVKWHKKREESLQYGFMRFSPNDDCKNFNCVHNGKQTHYHCLQMNCVKIYVSTSDVQMHANYHRKDALIMQDGFQRYRATEECGMSTCPFQNERTTHFHCRRPECFFTFKNKADIEKHKGHHQRNDNFAKDGFRKFIKYEHCDFEGCKYSKVMNHIHCIRPECDYVVHSSSQILSHKRKHERRQISSSTSPNSSRFGRDEEDFYFPLQNGMKFSEALAEFKKKVSSVVVNSMTLLRLNESDRDIVYIEVTDPTSRELFAELHQSVTISDETVCPKYSCHGQQHGHYHCDWPGCKNRIGPLFKYRSHWLKHAWTGAALRCGLMKCRSHLGCNITHLHKHCFFWPLCQKVFHNSTSENHCDHLCEHLTFDENGRNENPDDAKLANRTPDENPLILSNETKSLFQSFNYSSSTPRRRGRPPKHKRDVHVPHCNPKGKMGLTECLDQNITREMFTKNRQHSQDSDPLRNIVFGIKMYEEGERCIDDKCHFQQGLQEHFHCAQPKCYLVSQSLVYINMHRKEFHGNLTIDEGFEHYDRTVDCRRRACHNNRLSRHYHCIRSGCDYSFVRYSTMRQHVKKHEQDLDDSCDDENSNKSVISNISFSDISSQAQSTQGLVNDSYRKLKENLKFCLPNIFNSLNQNRAQDTENDMDESESSHENPFLNILGLQPLKSLSCEHLLDSIVKEQLSKAMINTTNQKNGSPEIASSASDLIKTYFNNNLCENENQLNLPVNSD